MDDIVKMLEQTGIIMESNRLSQKSLTAEDRAIILEARMVAARAGWDRSSVEWIIEEGRERARARFRYQRF